MQRMPKIEGLYYAANPQFCEDIKVKYPELKDCDIYKLIEDFMTYTVQRMVDHRDGISLPLYMGNMFIGVFPVKGNNWEYRKDDKQIHYQVTTKDGYDHRIVYMTSRTRHRCGDNKFWGFTSSLESRDISFKGFNEDWKKYIMIPNIRFIKDAVKAVSTKNAIIRKSKDFMEDYNEFQ